MLNRKRSKRKRRFVLTCEPQRGPCMRVFVYEHLCAQHDAASPLAAEGRAMLLAVLTDLGALEDVRVSTIADPSWFPTLLDHSFYPPLRVGDEEKSHFLEAAHGCEFALMI